MEGGLSCEEDEQDDSARPDITLLVVFLVEDLRGNIVGSSQFLVKTLGSIVDKRCSEIDNLQLIEVLVLFE